MTDRISAAPDCARRTALLAIQAGVLIVFGLSLICWGALAVEAYELHLLSYLPFLFAAIALAWAFVAIFKGGR